MLFEDYDKYLDALRNWDWKSSRPVSKYEVILAHARDMLVNGSNNYILTPGMDALLNVVKVDSKFTVVNITNINMEDTSTIYNEFISKSNLSWIDLCFYEDKDGIHYDNYYDVLPIGEGINTTIKQYLNRLEEVADNLKQIPNDSLLFVADPEAYQKPLRYLLQSKGIQIRYYDPQPELPENIFIETTIINQNILSNSDSFHPTIGITYLITHYEGQELPPYTPQPIWYYYIIHNNKRIGLYTYQARFECDCFGNVTVFSKSNDDEKRTPLF